MYSMTELNCPYCEKAVNRSSEVVGKQRPPKHNDICLCAYCANASVIDENMNLRKLTPEEELELANNPIVSAARKSILEFNKANQLKRKFGFGYGNG